MAGSGAESPWPLVIGDSPPHGKAWGQAVEPDHAGGGQEGGCRWGAGGRGEAASTAWAYARAMTVAEDNAVITHKGGIRRLIFTLIIIYFSIYYFIYMSYP